MGAHERLRVGQQHVPLGGPGRPAGGAAVGTRPGLRLGQQDVRCGEVGPKCCAPGGAAMGAQQRLPRVCCVPQQRLPGVLC